MNSLERLRPEARAQIDGLLGSGKWTRPGDHPLARFDGLSLGDYTVVNLLGPRNAVGSRYFQLYLADADGRLADEPLALGLQNSGPFPAFNWIEMIQYRESLAVGGRALDLWGTGLDRPLCRFPRAAPPFHDHRQNPCPGLLSLGQRDSLPHGVTESQTS